MKLRTCLLVLLTLSMTTPPAWAARTRVHEMAESSQWGRKFGGMLGRGALNIFTSPVDVAVNVVNETKAGPPFVGTLTGLGKGLGCGLLRFGSGAVDVVTSWVPGFNGFPVSDSYANCLAQSSMEVPATSAEPEAFQEQDWHVPTAEPGAAQAPTPPPARSKKTWTK
jgi:hypothetical protein